jgi:hypothetical protein
MFEVDIKITAYNNKLSQEYKTICDKLIMLIRTEIPHAHGKIWHAHPVWFINENPIVGYSLQKKGIRLMFWSGADFVNHPKTVFGGKFKDASVFYNDIEEVNDTQINSWLKDSHEIQYDYKNIVKRKGILERLS